MSEPTAGTPTLSALLTIHSNALATNTFNRTLTWKALASPFAHVSQPLHAFATFSTTRLNPFGFPRTSQHDCWSHTLSSCLLIHVSTMGFPQEAKQKNSWGPLVQKQRLSKENIYLTSVPEQKFSESSTDAQSLLN